MTDYKYESQPMSQTNRLIDFKTVKIVPGIINGTKFLIVSGEVPYENMEVKLQPRFYVMCPEYWEIEVVGCLPGGIGLPKLTPFSVSRQLNGIIGYKGIEVVGATMSEKQEVSGGCSQNNE